MSRSPRTPFLACRHTADTVTADLMAKMERAAAAAALVVSSPGITGGSESLLTMPFAMVGRH